MTVNDVKIFYANHHPKPYNRRYFPCRMEPEGTCFKTSYTFWWMVVELLTQPQQWCHTINRRWGVVGGGGVTSLPTRAPVATDSSTWRSEPFVFEVQLQLRPSSATFWKKSFTTSTPGILWIAPEVIKLIYIFVTNNFF